MLRKKQTNTDSDEKGIYFLYNIQMIFNPLGDHFAKPWRAVIYTQLYNTFFNVNLQIVYFQVLKVWERNLFSAFLRHF